MPKLEFIGEGSRDSGNIAANPARLVNFYREPVTNQGRTAYILRSVPGVQSFVDLNRIFLRAIEEIGGFAYAVCGGRVTRIAPNGDVLNIGSVPDSNETSIAGNNGRVSIVAGGEYWVWDGTTFSLVPVPALTASGSCAFLGGYTAVSQRDGRLVAWSQLVNAQTMPPANVRASETTDENVVRVMTIQERLVVFKPNSHEQWQVTGQANERALALIVGSQNEVGLADFSLIVTYPNGAAFVGSDGRVYAWTPGAMQPISTPAVEVALDTLEPKRMFFYERRGHGFICVTFQNGPAWCFDVATGEWHERAEGVTTVRWSAIDTVKLGTAWLVAYDDGRVGKFVPEPKDFGAAMRRVAVSRTLWTGQRFTVPLLEVFAQVGYGRDADVQFIADQGVTLIGEAAFGFLANGVDMRTEPLIELRVSRDGVTWGLAKQRGLGAKGNYAHRITFRAMGQFRNMAVELSMTDAIDVPIYTDMNVEVA